MSHLRMTLGRVLICFALIGCKDAKQFVAESKEGYRVAKEVAGQVAELGASLKTNDFAKAKEIGAKADQLMNTKVLSWYVQILATEEKEGNEAAKSLIVRLKSSEGITEDERVALNKIDQYFQRKGNTRTSVEAANTLVLISALVVEQKYGHGAGEIVLALGIAGTNRAPAAMAAGTNVPTRVSSH